MKKLQKLQLPIQHGLQNPTPAAPTPSVAAGRCGSSFLFFQKQASGASLEADLIGSDLQRVRTNGSYALAPTSFCSIIVDMDSVPAQRAGGLAGYEQEDLRGCCKLLLLLPLLYTCAGLMSMLTLFLGSSLPLVLLTGLECSGNHLMKSVLQTQVSLDTSIDSLGSHIINSKQSGKSG
jgi:hypothetical protein